MNIQEAILTRRTIQSFRPGEVDRAAIDRALEAAIRAPNHKLTNPWRFTHFGPKARAQIDALGIELKLKGRTPTPEMMERLRAKFEYPAHLIAVSQILDDDDFRRREDYGAVACAIQHICLSLWAEDIGTKWGTGSVTRHEKTYEILGIDPEVEEIVGFVWIGIPADIPSTPRTELAQVTRTTE